MCGYGRVASIVAVKLFLMVNEVEGLVVMTTTAGRMERWWWWWNEGGRRMGDKKRERVTVDDLLRDDRRQRVFRVDWKQCDRKYCLLPDSICSVGFRA